MDILEFEMHRLRSLRAMQAGLLELKLMRDIARLEIAIRRHGSALKAGYRPDQPRVPQGQREGGQWVDDGGSSGRIVLAGDIPTNDTPEIPKDRPPKSEDRSKAKKVVARWLDRVGASIDTALALGKAGAWLRTYSAEIESYRDPPKSLEELQQAVSTPRPGYDIHHIVERNQEGRFSSEAIYGTENEVSIPRLKHQEINSWYQTKNPGFGGESPRDYLNGRSWDVQRAVGLEALKEKGVLKP
jgi:hypothetical protein